MKKEPAGSFFYSGGAVGGFTLPELIAVLLIMSILAFVAVPRLSTSMFDDAKFYDETVAALRYAQRAATTYQRTVCVAFTGNSLSLSYSSAYTPPSCDTVLKPPAGTTQYVVNAPSASSYSAASSFNFDRRGVPSAGQTITLSSGLSITVEGDTGYVH
jgi:MSHA pilin protein MshC